jgi:hypothetical protein
LGESEKGHGHLETTPGHLARSPKRNPTLYRSSAKKSNTSTRQPPAPQPAASFIPRLNSAINLLRQAYRSQSEIGWENFVKGRNFQQWDRYIKNHMRHNGMKLNKRKWPVKLIIALWVHLLWIWTFRNIVIHANDNEQTSHYKVEELSRKMDAVWTRHQERQGQMEDFQLRHFEDREPTENLRDGNKACWTIMIVLFLDETDIGYHTTLSRWNHFLNPAMG